MVRNQGTSIWLFIIAALMLVLIALAVSNNFTNSALAAEYPTHNIVTSWVSPQ